MTAPTRQEEPLLPAWQALQRGALPELAPLQQWLATHPERAADPLALLAALDRLRREPACEACREAAMRALWPLLPEAPAEVEARPALEAGARAYLESWSEAPP